MKTYIAVAAALMLSLGGCTSQRISKDLAAGQIGCRPDEIKIWDETARFSVHTWTAVCHGKQYVCSYQSTAGSRCTLRQEDAPSIVANPSTGASSAVPTGPVPWYQTPVRDDPLAK